MVLAQLDAYYAGRQLQHLYPWTSVSLAQRQERDHPGVELVVGCGYEALAGFHVMQLITDCIPLLLFSDPKARHHGVCELGKHGSQCDGRESPVWAFPAPRGPASLCHLPSPRKSNARY